MFPILDRTKPTRLITLGDCTRISAIVARCIVQSTNHKRNLQIICKLILMALDAEFKEDGPISLKAFLLEAVDHAYNELYPPKNDAQAAGEFSTGT